MKFEFPLQVYNWLPTISSVIGGFTPQRYVWRICIALHASPRLMVAVGYYSFHTSVHVGARNELYMGLAALNSLLHIVEILSLVSLSMISSTENGGEFHFELPFPLPLISVCLNSFFVHKVACSLL